MRAKKVIVLDHERIQRITERFAHQIIENHFEESEIIIIGVGGRGEILAKRVADGVTKNSAIKVTLTSLIINKDNPLSEDPLLSIDEKLIQRKAIVLIDDVLNSGRTLVHSLSFLLKNDVERISTAVLVDRIHRKFPVKADYTGITLSTNLQEHVSVTFSEDNDYAYLC